MLTQTSLKHYFTHCTLLHSQANIYFITCILAVILQNYIRFPGETVQQDEVFIAEYKRCWAPCTIIARDSIVASKSEVKIWS